MIERILHWRQQSVCDDLNSRVEVNIRFHRQPVPPMNRRRKRQFFRVVVGNGTVRIIRPNPLIMELLDGTQTLNGPVTHPDDINAWPKTPRVFSADFGCYCRP